MLSFSVLAIALLSQKSASEDCAECSTFTWDECYWDWEAQWNECSWVWDEDNGVEPYDKQCTEELVSNQKDCLDAAGCFEPNNDDCWYNNYVFGCYLYNCEQYTLCYKSYQKGCNETRDFCEESCGVETADDAGDSYSYSMSLDDDDHYEPWYTDDPYGSAGYDDSYGNDAGSYYDDSYNWYNYHDSGNYDDSYGDDNNEYSDYGQCSDGYCSDYGSYNDNYDEYGDHYDHYHHYDHYDHYEHYDCDCGNGIDYDCCDYYGYGYDHYYYDDQEPWEYCYDEVPECVKENCHQLLLTCAEEENCVSAIEQFVGHCGNSDDPTVCIEDLFSNTVGDNASGERLQGFCNNDSQCLNDIKALGECVVNHDCHKGEDKLVKKRLNTLVKGLNKLRKQKLKLKLHRGKQARIKAEKRKLAKKKLVRKRPRKRSRGKMMERQRGRKVGRRSRRKLASGSRERRGERKRMRRMSRERVQRHRSKQQKLRGNKGKRVRAARRNKQRERLRSRVMRVNLDELSAKQRAALKKQTTIFGKEKRKYYQEQRRKEYKERPNPTPAYLQREKGVPKRKRHIKKRESTLRNSAKSD